MWFDHSEAATAYWSPQRNAVMLLRKTLYNIRSLIFALSSWFNFALEAVQLMSIPNLL